MSKKCKNSVCFTSIGGQALMEGILMRGPKKDCIALRLPDGTIDLKIDDKPQKKKPLIFRIPFIRGIFIFISSMITGYKALMYSAEKTADLELDEEPSKLDKWLEEHFSGAVMTVIGIISLILGLGLSLVLFKFLPTLAVKGIDLLSGGKLVSDFKFLASVIEGIMKMAIFVLYVWIVSFMKDIRITYQYHGAEHKTISCYEAGEELTPENARKYSRQHPRCGTSFMFLSIFVGIVVNFFITWTNVWARLGISLLLLPLTMGLGYEAIKLCGKHNNAFTRAIAAPGKWIQLITTKEPTDRQLEVAIAAIKAVIPEDGSDKIGGNIDA